MRNSRSLAGTWQFQLDPDGSLTPQSAFQDPQSKIQNPKSKIRDIPVPLPWQAAFPDLEQYSGYAWYRRSIEIEDEWLRGELLLRFGAVDYWCRVFVNGQQVGEHEGGYTPFEVSIKEQAHPGPNELVVHVYDPAQSGLPVPRWPPAEETEAGEPQIRNPQSPPFEAENVPHGKQEWYINVGGIWQDVGLVALPASYVSLLHVSTDIRSGEAHVHVELGGAALQEGATLQLSISAEGAEVANSAADLTPGQNVYDATLRVENHRLWSPEDPYLYTLTATLEQQPATGDQPPTPDRQSAIRNPHSAISDSLTTRFGFREIATKNGQILLNGEPVFLLCALDQDLYPDTIYTVPSEEFLRDQFEKARHLGLNSLRCHIKPPDPRYLDLADEMGLMVWAEIPSWRTFYNKPLLHSGQIELDDVVKRRVETTLEEMVRRDFNHPSLVIWTIVNEDWGTSLPLCSADRAWVATMYERCKELDPTRLVVDNSACPHPWGPNIHVHSDLDDFHMYANIPDHARSFAQSIEQFALRPMWTYSTHGDATRSGDEPLVLSEFGNWGLPSLEALRKHYGGDPGWFDTYAWWSPWEGEAALAEGAGERFRILGLDSIWDDYEAFAEATQWHQYQAMKFEIEAMRRQPTLAGYVITEFTDAYWESNGLLDFARNPKAHYDCFSSINSPDMIAPFVRERAYWDDRPLVIRLFLAHYSPASWEGARLRWEVEGTSASGEYRVANLAPGEVRQARGLSLRLARVGETTTLRVLFTLLGAGGEEIARNDVEVLVMPSTMRRASYKGPVAVVTGPEQLFEESEEATGLPALSPEAVTLDEESPLGGQSQDQALSETPATEELAPVGLNRIMGALGYNVSGKLGADAELAVTTRPTARLLQWVRDGGSLLFLSDGASPFFWTQRRLGAYSGSWITSFSWLRTEIHRRLKVKNPLGMPFLQAMPRMTILGLPFDDKAVQGDFLAGMVSGWVHHPAVHTVQFRYGRGRVLMTTFAIETGLSQGDAVAIALLHDLVEYLCSDACRPVIEANY